VGAVVFAKACELGLEGIVSKWAGSFYRAGRSRDWLKTKNPDSSGPDRHALRRSSVSMGKRISSGWMARTGPDG
jgi:ATP-dependent DNA ligase